MNGTRGRMLAAVAAFGVLVAPVATAPVAASGTVDGPSGVMCGLTAATDTSPDAAPGAMTGTVDAGPLLLTLDGVLRRGWLRCSIQLGYPQHAAPDVVVVTGTGTDVAVVTPTAVAFTAAPETPVYQCTEVDFEGWGRLYWASNGLGGGNWTYDATASCDAGLSVDVPLDDVTVAAVDPIVCPQLSAVFPPDGDVPDVWDCPPYGSARTADRQGGNDVKANGNGGGSAPGAPGGGPSTPLPPYYPTGTIEISSTLPGSISYGYTAFTPGRSAWTCSEVDTTVTCTPPAAPNGYANTCGVVDVQVTNSGGGAVSGSSRCTSGQSAFATSFGPSTTPNGNSGQANSPFPFTCAATVTQSAPGPWTVRCTVGH